MTTHSSTVSTPALIGRSAGTHPVEEHARASTSKACDEAVEYCSGAVGVARAEVFASTDDEDRGGFVLRLTTEDRGGSFHPTARLVDGGVEVHLAGDAEAEAILRALASAIASTNTD